MRRWEGGRRREDRKGIRERHGGKCVCSQLLQPLGLRRRKGGVEERKSPNYSSVCRQWVRRWATTRTQHAVRQRQERHIISLLNAVRRAQVKNVKNGED